jgi:phosphopantothenate synthetase
LTTEVVNIRKSEYDVYIGRPGKGVKSIWGNPFSRGSREANIAKFEAYLLETPELIRKLPEIRDKRLGCFCKPKDCHGDVLKRFLDQFSDAQLALLAQQLENGVFTTYNDIKRL